MAGLEFKRPGGLAGLEAVRVSQLRQDIALHAHAVYCLGLNSRAGRIVRTASGEHSAGPGQALLIEPGLAHACLPSGREGQSYDMLCLNRGLFKRLLGEAGLGPDLPGFASIVTGDPLVCAALARVFSLVWSAGHQDELEQALRELLRGLSLGGLLAFRAGPYRPESLAVAKALRYLREKFSDDVSLAELAAASGQSPYHLLRSFKQSLGLTPHAYLNLLRFKRAKLLLGQGAKPGFAALECGFYDQSHFNNVFKKFMGLSPGAYTASLARPS